MLPPLPSPPSEACNTMNHFLRSCNGWIPIICNTIHEVTAFMGEVDLFPNHEYIMWLLVKFASDISNSLEKGRLFYLLNDSELIQCLEYIDQSSRSIILIPQGPPRFCMEFMSASGVFCYFISASCVQDLGTHPKLLAHLQGCSLHHPVSIPPGEQNHGLEGGYGCGRSPACYCRNAGRPKVPTYIQDAGNKSIFFQKVSTHIYKDGIWMYQGPPIKTWLHKTFYSGVYGISS